MLSRIASGRWLGRRSRREALTFYLFAAPYIIGLIAFTLGPILASLVLSLTSYDLLRPPRFIGLDNYYQLFFEDPDFWKSLRATILYTVMHVPLVVTVPLAVALLLNQKVIGLPVFRTIFYVPSVMSGVAVSILWRSPSLPQLLRWHAQRPIKLAGRIFPGDNGGQFNKRIIVIKLAQPCE